MTFTKIALTVLGTVGLTAGTVLAVAEPAPPELPQATAQAGACGGCPSRACGTAKCLSATSACARATETACSAENAACAAKCDQAECGHQTAEAAPPSCDGCPNAAIGRPDLPQGLRAFVGSLVSATVCDSNECSAGAPSQGSRHGHTRKLTLSFGISSDGPILRLTSGTADCADDTCPTAITGCGATCEKVATASCPTSACKQAGCEATACTQHGACHDETHEAAVTACDATPACATSGCPDSACAASVCNGSICAAAACDGSTCGDTECAASKCASCPHGGCASGAVAAGEAGRPGPACSVAACDCQDCCCEACDCTTDAACPPGVLCPVAARLPGFDPGGILPNGIHLMATGIIPEAGDASCEGEACLNNDLYRSAVPHGPGSGAPGRVRLTHLPDLRFLNGPPEFPPHANLIFTSFAAPVVAPMPPAAPASPRVMDGSWTRTTGPWTVTFAIEHGRLRGACTAEDGAATVRFSGTCCVSDDGQIFGVLDEADVLSDALEGTAEARSVAVRLIDQPFAVRFRFDGESLIVKDLRCAGLPPEQVRQVACGRFERAE